VTDGERLAALLDGFDREDLVRLRPLAFAAEFLALSLPTVYRLAAEGRLPVVKLAGADRGAKGRAGAVRVRLMDLIRWSVERERGALAAPMPVSSRRASADVRKLAEAG
jgi:hypothetical protein